VICPGAGGGWVLMTTIWEKLINLSNKSTFFLLKSSILSELGKKRVFCVSFQGTFGEILRSAVFFVSVSQKKLHVT
jgi:hypothetical protein